MKNVQILFCFTISILIGVCLLLSSCKGSGGKKAATEAMEFLEKETGSIERNASRIEKDNASKLHNNLQEEYGSYSKYRRAKQRVEKIDKYLGEDEDPESTPQPVSIDCPRCQGNGMVYMTDMYGNVVFDYYGNPQVVTCPNCGGTRQVVVYQ